MPMHRLSDELPAWIDEPTVRAIENAARQARARGRDGASDAWEAAWMRHPALPTTIVIEAIAIVLRRAGL